MPDEPTAALSAEDLHTLLAVTRALAAPFELHQMLATVAAAACTVLHAERSSVWLLDATRNELVLEVTRDLPPVRVPVGTGLVGCCAAQREPVNVPDCYADPRFNPDMDRRSGFHTRNSLTLPLIDDRDALVGVMQVLNARRGSFDAGDEALGAALAAQCAVALSRVRLAEAMLAGELLKQELEMASALQRSTLPAALPDVPGYDMHALFRPASQTGGDTYDVARTPQGLLLVLADAAGHGLPAALSVTQMHAMLRVALAMDAPLPGAYAHVNDRLAATLPDGRFVTAFVGLLDEAMHTVRFVSGGQGPILHWHAATGEPSWHRATSFPMGAARLRAPPAMAELALAPGDWLVLLSDGLYEQEDAEGRPFGRDRVAALVHALQAEGAQALGDALLQAVLAHAGPTGQADDMTLLLVHRRARG